MSADLAGRRFFASAVLADYGRETGEYLKDTRNNPRPDMGMWAQRLSSELGQLLKQLDDDAEAAPDPAAAQLAEVRAVLAAFDWETDDRQYALEKIDDIVNGRPR